MEITLSKYTAEQAAKLSAELKKYIDELDGRLHPRMVHIAAAKAVSVLPFFLIPGMFAHYAGNRMIALTLLTLAFGAFVFSAVSFLFDLVSIRLSFHKHPEWYELYVRLLKESHQIEDLAQLLLFADIFQQIEDEASGKGDKGNVLHQPAQRMLTLLRSGKKIQGIDLRTAGMGRHSDMASMIIREEGHWDFSFLDEKLESWVDHVDALCGNTTHMDGMKRLVLERPVQARQTRRIVLEVDQA